MKQTLTAELLAEFLGTLVLILFGNGVVAMVLLFGHGLPGEIVNGGYTNITLAWGLAVTMGIYVAGKTTGAHLNPAVTIALAAFRGFPWRKVIPYCVAQITGAFVAAGLVSGKRLTCYEHVKLEVTSAGGEWIGQESVRDGKFVTAQTWISHPDFYRQVMECLQG